MSKAFLFLGSFNAFLCVLLGAFGAHALKSRLSPDLLEIYGTAVQYHFYHALGLLAVGVISLQLPNSGYVKWSGWAMVIGIVLFCGSLYALSLSGARWLGAITPLGGTAFLGAWLLLAVAALKAL